MYDNIISSCERCALKSCNKKLTLVNNYECECSNHCCIKHKFSMDHDCIFDYKKNNNKYYKKIYKK
jgi:hypothetical protein